MYYSCCIGSEISILKPVLLTKSAILGTPTRHANICLAMNDNHKSNFWQTSWITKISINELWITKIKLITIRATVLGLHEMWHWWITVILKLFYIYLTSARYKAFFCTVQPASVPAAYRQRPGNGSGPQFALAWGTMRGPGGRTRHKSKPMRGRTCFKAWSNSTFWHCQTS